MYPNGTLYISVSRNYEVSSNIRVMIAGAPSEIRMIRCENNAISIFFCFIACLIYYKVLMVDTPDVSSSRKHYIN